MDTSQAKCCKTKENKNDLWKLEEALYTYAYTQRRMNN